MIVAHDKGDDPYWGEEVEGPSQSMGSRHGRLSFIILSKISTLCICISKSQQKEISGDL